LSAVNWLILVVTLLASGTEQSARHHRQRAIS
jgi:hypothetical protein